LGCGPLPDIFSCAAKTFFSSVFPFFFFLYERDFFPALFPSAKTSPGKTPYANGFTLRRSAPCRSTTSGSNPFPAPAPKARFPTVGPLFLWRRSLQGFLFFPKAKRRQTLLRFHPRSVHKLSQILSSLPKHQYRIGSSPHPAFSPRSSTYPLRTLSQDFLTSSSPRGRPPPRSPRFAYLSPQESGENLIFFIFKLQVSLFHGPKFDRPYPFSPSSD